MTTPTLNIDYRMDKTAHAMCKRSLANQHAFIVPLKPVLRQFYEVATAVLQNSIESIETPIHSVDSKHHVTIWGCVRFNDELEDDGISLEQYIELRAFTQHEIPYVRQRFDQLGLSALLDEITPKVFGRIETKINEAFYGSMLRVNWKSFESQMIDMEGFKPYELFDTSSLKTQAGLMNLLRTTLYVVDTLYLIQGKGRQGVKQLKATPYWPVKDALKTILTKYQHFLFIAHTFEMIENRPLESIQYEDVVRIIQDAKSKAEVESDD